MALLSVVASLSGCDRPRSLEFSGAAQGTTWRVAVVADAHERDRLQALVEQRLAELDRALSSYRDDSELQRFNTAPVGAWFPLGPDLYRVLRTARSISVLTDGAFDVTSAPLVELWGFGPRNADGGKRGSIPDDAAIAAAQSLVDYRRLDIDEAMPRARKTHLLIIDVNGIAQGYSVDSLAELLLAHGYRDFLVEVGGEFRLSGLSAQGKRWRIGIEQPADIGGIVQQAVSGTDIAITTAGDYHDYFERDGVRYSHTIDPATGRPISHTLASVTVIARDATYADGMDTALEVLGPERGYELAQRLNIAAYFIVRAGDGFAVRHTPEFERYLH